MLSEVVEDSRAAWADVAKVVDVATTVECENSVELFIGCVSLEFQPVEGVL